MIARSRSETELLLRNFVRYAARQARDTYRGRVFHDFGRNPNGEVIHRPDGSLVVVWHYTGRPNRRLAEEQISVAKSIRRKLRLKLGIGDGIAKLQRKS